VARSGAPPSGFAALAIEVGWRSVVSELGFDVESVDVASTVARPSTYDDLRRCDDALSSLSSRGGGGMHDANVEAFRLA
jgi:hypothetical protein